MPSLVHICLKQQSHSISPPVQGPIVIDFLISITSNNLATVRKGGDYVINGSKMWITNGELADVAVIWAQTEEGIQGFLVEKGMPGFQAFPIPWKYSLRASVTS